MTCDFPDCTRTRTRTGLCRSHTRQQALGQALRPLLTPGRGCDVPGCPNPHKARGLCATHRNQKARGVAFTLPTPQASRQPRMPRPAKPASVLPKGWDRTTPPVKPRMGAFKGQAEIPLVGPTDPALVARAARTVELMARVLGFPADELADELGLVAA
mgnify:CR=1 FL=1